MCTFTTAAVFLQCAAHNSAPQHCRKERVLCQLLCYAISSVTYIHTLQQCSARGTSPLCCFASIKMASPHHKEGSARRVQLCASTLRQQKSVMLNIDAMSLAPFIHKHSTAAAMLRQRHVYVAHCLALIERRRRLFQGHCASFPHCSRVLHRHHSFADLTRNRQAMYTYMPHVLYTYTTLQSFFDAQRTTLRLNTAPAKECHVKHRCYAISSVHT